MKKKTYSEVLRDMLILAHDPQNARLSYFHSYFRPPLKRQNSAILTTQLLANPISLVVYFTPSRRDSRNFVVMQNEHFSVKTGSF